MRKQHSMLVIASSLVCASSFAGSPEDKQVAPPPPPWVPCGTGWYFGIDGGANVYQDFGGTHNLGVINGETVTAEANHHVGGYGGIKFGYIFGQGPFRFGLEEDYFYNGVDARTHIDLDGSEVAAIKGFF